jgi:hypothetical protein
MPLYSKCKFHEGLIGIKIRCHISKLDDLICHLGYQSLMLR